MEARDLAHADGHEGVGLYVFCFTRADAAQGAATGPGLAEGAHLGALVHEELAAICCEVPLHEWTGPAGEAHLQDLAWLGPRALRHEAVIERAMRTSPVLPLRFGCLFSSAERLAELLRRERARIDDFLTQAAQQEEWTLEGTLDLAACAEARFAADPRVARLPASAGARYLLEQKLRKDAAHAARAWVKEAEADIARALEGMSLSRRALRATPRRAEGTALERVLYWALLLPRGARAELDARLGPLAERLSTEGLHLSAQGPLAPYHFAPRLVDDPGAEESAEEPANG